MKKAFTLTEVLVAALIVAITFGGLIASFKASRTYISRSSKRVVAANIARGVLNELDNYVRADMWDVAELDGETNRLYTGGGGVFDLDDLSDEYPGYSGSYTVEDDADGYRKVTVTINYPAN